MSRSGRESAVEAYLRERVEALGGVAVKLSPDHAVGIPDRLVLLPGRVALVELKRPRGGILSAAQRRWGALIRRLDIEYHVLSNKEQIDDFTR